MIVQTGKKMAAPGHSQRQIFFDDYYKDTVRKILTISFQYKNNPDITQIACFMPNLIF